MGLKDAFVNIAASAITSRVNSAVGGVLDAAFGSKGRTSSSGPAAALDNKTRFTTDNLSYPINVEGDPMQGHYILFSAREQDPAKLKAKVKGESPAALGKKINAQNGIGQTLKNGKAAIKNSPIKNLNVAALKNAKGNPKTTSANAITTSKIASSRVTTTIALYMPPSVAVSYDSKYADAEIGNLAQFGMEAFNTLSAGGDFSDMGKKLGSSVKERGGAALKKGAVKAADAAAPGAAALIALERGKIVTPKMELMFEGIGRRSFSFSFVFIPKSEAEAIVVDKIIAKFKFHMTPVFMDGAREMKIPDVFDIEYMYQDRQNNFLNKISTCYLQKADVSYGGDRFTAYEPASTYKPGSPPPQRTTLALTFGEIELIDRDKVTEGY